MHQPVAVFWDYENCHPPANTSGLLLVERIRCIAHVYGEIIIFNAYADMSIECCGAKVGQLHSELQSSGVSLIHCPHNGKKEVVDKMMLVDMIAFAIDNRAPATIVVISGDRDFSYGVSKLRLRGYNAIIIAPSPNAHSHLVAQGDKSFRWQDVLNRETDKGTVSPTVVQCSEPDLSTNSSSVSESHPAIMSQSEELQIPRSQPSIMGTRRFDISSENTIPVVRRRDANVLEFQPITMSTSTYKDEDEEKDENLHAPSSPTNVSDSNRTTNTTNSSSITYQTTSPNIHTDATIFRPSILLHNTEDSQMGISTADNDLLHSSDTSFRFIKSELNFNDSRPSTPDNFVTPSASIADDNEFICFAKDGTENPMHLATHNADTQDYDSKNEQSAMTNLLNISTESIQQMKETQKVLCPSLDDLPEGKVLSFEAFNLTETITMLTDMTQNSSDVKKDRLSYDGEQQSQIIQNHITLASASTSEIKPLTKEVFKPIVRVLKKLQTEGVPEIRWSQLAQLLNFRSLGLFESAGIATFKKYVEQAEIAGYISVEGSEEDMNLHWVRLQINCISEELDETEMNPNLTNVAIRSNTGVTSKIDPIFVPLVDSIKDLQLQGGTNGTANQILRSRLGGILIKKYPYVYKGAKVGNFFKYLEKAAEIGLVILGSEGKGKEWVKLVEF